MTVEGLFNPSHVLRSFIAAEYAFCVFYPKHEIRIAHQKGSWYCVKMEKTEIIDTIQIDDSFGSHWAMMDMTEALYDSLKTQHRSLPPTRENEALVIEKFLKIWGGKTQTVGKIVAVQPGRNAIIDGDTGEFELSPREDEFKK